MAVKGDEVGGSTTTRSGIKRVAAQLMAARGYHSTSLRQLANAAGITLGTLYHYFPSKEDLLSELFDDAMRPLMDTLEGVEQQAEKDPVGTLHRMIESFIRIAVDELGAALVLIADSELRALSPERLEHAIKQRDEYEKTMLSVVEAGRARGLFTVSDPKLAVYAILGICNSVTRWYRPSGPYTSEETARLNADLAMKVVGVTEMPSG